MKLHESTHTTQSCKKSGAKNIVPITHLETAQRSFRPYDDDDDDEVMLNVLRCQLTY